MVHANAAPARPARRRLLVATAALAGLAAACSRRPPRIIRIGVLSSGPPPPPGGASTSLAAFVQGLREHGYEPGRTVVLEERYADGSAERLAALARDLVAANVDVILAGSTAAAVAARKATTRIPIVMGSAADPVGAGLVASLARPGTNVTGLALDTPDIAAKRLEILHAIVPALARAAAFYPGELRSFAVVERWLDESARAAHALGIALAPVDLGYDPSRWHAIVGEARVRGTQGAVVVETSQYFGYRRELAAVMLAHRLPVVFPFGAHADAGGLAGYGADVADLWRRAAAFVHRIAGGEDPATIPVELPTRFDLAINATTAKALGLAIPRALGVRARVIE